MTGKRIVITGAAGVIGCELLSRLLEQGAEILSLDREPLRPEFAARVTHLQVDLAVGGMDEIASFAPEEVYHLAAAFERSIEESGFWDVNFYDNIVVTHRLHSTLRKLASVKVYVFASSYLIYQPDLYMFEAPRDDAHGLLESDPVGPRNLCGAAKYLAEQEIAFLTGVDRRGLRAVNARIYRAYGRGSRCVISRWVRSLLRAEEITVHNAGNRFDYVFAGDVAEGLLRLGKAEAAQGVVNLATGRSRTVFEVVDVLRHTINGAGGLLRMTEDHPPFEASQADISQLATLTGWCPGIAIEEGIDLIVDYERKRLVTAEGLTA